MLPLLIFGGIAAAALLSGCGRSESNGNSRPSPTPTPEDHSHHHPAPLTSTSAAIQSGTPYRFQSSLALTNATQEYLDLCEVLFGSRDSAHCDGIRASSAMTEEASSTRGLNAYYRGILQGAPGYSFEHADRGAPWSNRLHRLQGSRLYLAGHGGCLTSNPQPESCLKLNDGREIPSQFNFMDDYFNLVGTFFFLQANRPMIEQGGRCNLVFATLGNESRPFCHAFAIHNIALTPVSQRLRGVDPAVHLQPLGLATSECRVP